MQKSESSPIFLGSLKAYHEQAEGYIRIQNVLKILTLSLLLLISTLLPVGRGFFIHAYAEEKKVETVKEEAIKEPGFLEKNTAKEPIIINADKVEYSTDAKEVTATGNAEVTYKGAKLTCQKLTVNSQTKVGIAEGNARLDDRKGVIEGEKIIYNFEAKIGTIFDSQFRANPYFGKAKKVEKISDAEFIAFRGYFTTCGLDHPHYRISSKKMDIFPNDKIQTKQDTVYLGQVPVMSLPAYSHSLKDPLMHVQMMPGKSKDWGPYMLSAWRYNLTDYLSGRLYLDARGKLGTAEGFGTNYASEDFGKGDLKYYFTKERPDDLPKNIPQGVKTRYTRYFIRWRHKWDIDNQTNFVSEFYKLTDKRRKLLDTQRNFLKDYFFREYEKDAQPSTYALLHHNFQYSSVDLLLQKRTNHWFDQLNAMPEVKYSLPSLQVAHSPIYFENNSAFDNFNKKATTLIPTSDEISVTRLDTTNKFSLPMKVAFVAFNPFVSSRQTFYDKGADGSSTPIRNIFYSGADLSTKFYRIFNVKSNFLGLDLNGLRHIITPTIGYTFNHEPSILSSKLKQIDSVDSITRSNGASLELSNKLQTKRKGQSVDLADLRVSSSYIFKPKTGYKRGSSLSDLLFDINLFPYPWMSLVAEVTYKHSGNRSDPNYNTFSSTNYDINFNFGVDRSFAFGQRYLRKGSNELTYSFNYRISPKWRFVFYNRYERGHDASVKRGLREQEYTISRDLHCWIMDFTWNITRGQGESVYLVFRLKAFPEMQFDYNQSYHQPKPGSQSNY